MFTSDLHKLLYIILLTMIGFITACSDDSPQPGTDDEDVSYVPNAGLRYKRIKGANFDYQFYYDKHGRADSVLYTYEQNQETHLRFHYKPDFITSVKIYTPNPYFQYITYDTIVPYYNRFGCIYHLDRTSYLPKEDGYEGEREEVSMTYDDSVHLKNMAAEHHYWSFTNQHEPVTEKKGYDICLLGWYNGNLYEVNATKSDSITYHGKIKTTCINKVAHTFSYDEQPQANYPNKYASYTFSSTQFLDHMNLDYLRPLAFLGLLGKGPQALPDSCYFSIYEKYEEGGWSFNSIGFRENYQFDSDNRLTSQRYYSTYEY